MKSTIVACAALLLAVSSVQANSIAVNFSDGRGGQGGGDYVPLAASDTAGVVPQQNWNDGYDRNQGAPTGYTIYRSIPNNIEPAGPLVDNTGADSGATVTYYANGSYSVRGQGNAPVSGDARMMDAYLDQLNRGSTPTTVSFTNIPYASYYVYAYVGSDVNGRTGHGWINGNTATSIYFQTNDSPSFSGFTAATGTNFGTANPADYLKFYATGPSLTFQLIGDDNNVGLHGMQIAVPEPASLVLLAVGAVGLFVVARRRRKA